MIRRLIAISAVITLVFSSGFTALAQNFGMSGSRGGGMGSSMTTGETSTIHIGQIDLDMYAPESKKLFLVC